MSVDWAKGTKSGKPRTSDAAMHPYALTAAKLKAIDKKAAKAGMEKS